VRHAHENQAEVTLWVWAPEATPMDLRFYHDGLGQDTHEKQIKGGLEITYEDYEPGFGTPMGVARTSELMLWVLPATPARERLTELANALRAPAVMVPTPQTSFESGVFGHSFSLPSQSPAEHTQLEQRLDWMFDFYRGQQDQRGWYGFWNYGDVMHTYDFDRHEWRYDIGGFAWDNSELATDLWLWLYFLRTGRADTFRFAEAMTRHTGEVDVHHLGKFAPLGSRHNVMHWGCSAKQLRISTALNRRYYYFLTADERVGDLMREQLEAARTLRTVLATRKLPGAESRQVDVKENFAHLGFGTDWGSLAGAWLTEWERTRDPKMRERLVTSMKSIAAQPKGFFTGGERMNLVTGAFDISKDSKLNVSHLSAAFGLPEVCSELIELLDVPEFERAWLLYCELYNGTDEQQKAALGESFGSINLQQGHARLTAYAAYRKKDAALAARAWKELTEGRSGYGARQQFASNRIEGPAVLNPVDEAPGVSTNASAQWGLAAIECLAYARRESPVGPWLLEFGRRERSRRVAHCAQAALVPAHLVEPHTERHLARRHRPERHGSFELAHAIHVVRHRRAVVRQRHPVPLVRAVHPLAVEQCQPAIRRIEEEGVERPLFRRDDAQLEQHARRAFVFDMQETLLGRASGTRLDQGFDREAAQARNGVVLEKHRVGFAIEANRAPVFFPDDARRAGHDHRIFSDAVEFLESPHRGSLLRAAFRHPAYE
jgi:hypothetical protein